MLGPVTQALSKLDARAPNDLAVVSLANFPLPAHVKAHIPVKLIGFRIEDVVTSCAGLIHAQQQTPTHLSNIKLPLHEAMMSVPPSP